MDLFGETATDEDFDGPVEEFHVSLAAEEGGELCHPRLMRQCIGHEKIEAALLSLIGQDKLPHALIFSGLKGIGKATMAYRLARYLLHSGKSDPGQGGMFDELPSEAPSSMNVSEESKDARLMASGAHPDFLALERLEDDKGNVKAGLEVAQLRRVNPFMRMKASEGGWRIVIVDDADTMNRNSQNAILKILEEPPENALLVLVTHRIGALIPTIRSRCRVIDFKSQEKDTMKALLTKAGHSFNDTEFETLFRLSGGSVGQALRLVNENGLEVLGKILTLMENYPAFRDTDIHMLADEYARPGNAATYELFTQLVSWMAAEMTRSKARGMQEVTQPFHLDAFARILRNSSLESLTKLCENLDAHFESVSRANLDKRQGVMEAFDILRAA